MRKVLVAIPFRADNVVYEANKEYGMDESIIERALNLNPNTLTVLGAGDEFAQLKADLEAVATAKEEAEAKANVESEARANAEEELAKVKEELATATKELAKANEEIKTLKAKAEKKTKDKE